jgi:hypothetical protein
MYRKFKNRQNESENPDYFGVGVTNGRRQKGALGKWGCSVA